MNEQIDCRLKNWSVSTIVAVICIASSSIVGCRKSSLAPSVVKQEVDLGPYNLLIEKPFRHIGLDTDSILADLEDSDWRIRLRASKAIEFRECPPALPLLIESSSSTQPELRVAATGAVGWIAYNANRERVRLPDLELALEVTIANCQNRSAPEADRSRMIGVAAEIAKNLGHDSIDSTIPIFLMSHHIR